MFIPFQIQISHKFITYCINLTGQYNLQTADRGQNADWGYKMQTEDKMQTGGELGIFYKCLEHHYLVENVKTKIILVFLHRTYSLLWSAILDINLEENYR